MTEIGGPIVVGVVGDTSSPLVAAVEGAGAVSEMCTEANAIAKADTVEAIVFDAGDSPERLLPVAATLANDDRTKPLPRLVLVADHVTAARVAPLGAVPVSLQNLDSAMADLVHRARTRSESALRARTDNAERRIAEQALATIKKEGVTLAHDARVLFGVILGFAGNLRDGFGGPVTDNQRGHLMNIVEAANDAASLFDRYVVDLRRSIEPPSGNRAPSTIPRAAGRRHRNDLSELARNTAALFGGLAAAKQIRLKTDAERSLYVWCDGMQVKQALVNLVANALKFTPAGGTVEVVVRPGPPSSTRGPTARRDVELVVIDSGPGIPEADRGRVFDRGVRLARDKDRPGTGIGLAVVRDVAEQHSGGVRVEENPGGGAAFVVTLPTDLRTRASDRGEKAE